ncbi:MAG: hypothetical protein ABI605_19080, partial [Rhizobacter sp.]
MNRSPLAGALHAPDRGNSAPDFAKSAGRAPNAVNEEGTDLVRFLLTPTCICMGAHGGFVGMGDFLEETLNGVSGAFRVCEK